MVREVCCISCRSECPDLVNLGQMVAGGRGVEIVVVHPNGDVGGEREARPWGDEGGREKRSA